MHSMTKLLFPLLCIVLLGVGCLNFGVRTDVSPPPVPERAEIGFMADEPIIDHPISQNIARYFHVQKGFGMYIEDRFRGYHVGLDIEIPTEKLTPEDAKEIPVIAIADGTVLFVDRASGYGGVMVIKHRVELLTPTAVYGHIDLSSAKFKIGDSVKRGDVIAFVGEDKTEETDGERQHLHFALYDDNESDDNTVYIQGYESDPAAVDNWINPLNFFAEFGYLKDYGDKFFAEFVSDYSSSVSDQFAIDFEYPSTWSVEYVPSLNAINLYDLYGEGTALERSQMFIRYFDASDFLTLSTVTIHSTEDLQIGEGDYVARRYDIEKKSGVPDFVGQPSWRNRRHIVTDFRYQEGKTRYYVVAKNPELDSSIYEEVLESMIIK